MKGSLVPDDSEDDYENYRTESEVEMSKGKEKGRGKFEVVKGGGVSGLQSVNSGQKSPNAEMLSGRSEERKGDIVEVMRFDDVPPSSSDRNYDEEQA